MARSTVVNINTLLRNTQAKPRIMAKPTIVSLNIDHITDSDFSSLMTVLLTPRVVVLLLPPDRGTMEEEGVFTGRVRVLAHFHAAGLGGADVDIGQQALRQGLARSSTAA
jgi:hypothetical protein